MNKRRYSNRRRKNILRVFILLMAIIITVVMWRTIKIDVQVGELTLPKILQSEKSFADTSGEWNLILVDRNHYIPNNYQVELTELSNGKKVDSRIYPELQQMFNDARAEGLALFVREGYRTTEEQQKIMDEKINEYEKQGYSAKEAKKRAEKYVAIPDTSEHQLGLSVDINADTDKCSSEKVYQWLDENAYKYGFVKRYPEDKTDITGISNEPWHYRYVGTTVAKIMKEENLCLEEYLEKYKYKQKNPNFFYSRIVILFRKQREANLRMEYKTDSLLVHLARAGDEDACEKLVKKYYSSIYQYCLLHINDPYEAEDLTQEVFTRFFSNLYRYKEYGKVKNYLYTIAGNTVKNYYKKKKDIPSEELLKSEDCSKNHVEELGVRLTIEQAVRKLPEEIRETAVLYFFQELKQREIAELLHIKLSLVKYRIGRAKELLMKELEVKKDEEL